MKNAKRPAASSPPAPVPASPSSLPSWLPWALFAGATVLLFLVYAPALEAPFLFDDLYLLFLAPGADRIPFSSWITGVRPLLQLSYWLNFQTSGQEPYAYHLVNLLLHLGAGVLAYLSARRLFSLAGHDDGKSRIGAAAVAGIFLFHPLQTESVAYVASRSEVLSGLFILAAWTVFLFRPLPAIGTARTVAVLALFVLALASKEHAVVIPALLLLTDWFLPAEGGLARVRANWKLYAPILLGAVAGTVAIFKLVLGRATSAGFGVKGMTPFDYLFTQFRSITTYLRLYILPFGQNADPDVAISHSLGDHLSWLALLFLLSLAGVAWYFRRQAPLAALGLFAFFILLAPTSSFVPIQDVLAERRMYLPVFALSLALFDVLLRRPLPVAAIAVALCAVLAGFTWQRAQVWAGPIPLWSNTAANSPAKYRPRFQLAYAQYQAGNCASATQDFAEAAKLIQPPPYELLADWALAEDCAGDTKSALKHAEQAAALESSAHAWSMVGMFRAKTGNLDGALQALDTAEARNPRFLVLHVYRGNVHTARRDWTAAAAAYARALEIDPNNAIARQGLARAKAAR